MRLPLLTVSLISAGLLATASAHAADMLAPEPPAYAPPPVAAVPPPVVVEPAPVVAAPVRPAGCWRYGAVGWGWYPCVGGPPPYWRDYGYGYGYRYGYGYGYGYGYRYGYRPGPYWAHARGWHGARW